MFVKFRIITDRPELEVSSRVNHSNLRFYSHQVRTDEEATITAKRPPFGEFDISRPLPIILSPSCPLKSFYAQRNLRKILFLCETKFSTESSRADIVGVKKVVTKPSRVVLPDRSSISR